MYESDDKMVSHPDHYQGANGMEVIDVIEAFTANLKGIEATDTGNIIKYACRWKEKGGVQDLKKIVWYATHLIEKLEKQPMTEVWEDVMRHKLDADVEIFSNFPTEESANKVLESLKTLFASRNNKCVTVADFYARSGKNELISDDERAFGWTNLDDAYVDFYQSEEDPNMYHWCIRMPWVKKLDKEKESN